MRTLAGILWNWMYSKKLPITSFKFVFGLLSQYFFPGNDYDSFIIILFTFVTVFRDMKY